MSDICNRIKSGVSAELRKTARGPALEGRVGQLESLGKRDAIIQKPTQSQQDRSGPLTPLK